MTATATMDTRLDQVADDDFDANTTHLPDAVVARVLAGWESCLRGEGEPAEKVFAELHAKYGI